MMFVRVVAVAVLLAATAYFLREFGWRGVPLFVTLGGLMIFSALGEYLPVLQEGISALRSLGVEDGTVAAVGKILGVGYLCGLCTDVCREWGSPALCSAVSAVGRAEILVICYPFLVTLVGYGTELLR